MMRLILYVLSLLPCLLYAEAECVALYPGNGTDGFFLPGNPVKMILTLKNDVKQGGAFRLKGRVTDFFGGQVYGIPERNITFPDNGKLRLELEIPALKMLGHFTVLVELSRDGQKLFDVQSAFAIVEPIERRDPFFGADVGNFYPRSAAGQKLAGIGSIGLLPSNFTFNPGELEEKFRNNPELKEIFDSDFQLVGFFSPLARNLYTLGGRNPAAGKKFDERIKQGLPCFSDEDISNAYELGRRSAELTRDRIKLWIVRAEYDVKVLQPHLYGGDAYVLAEMVALTRAFYRGIKAGNPQAKVAVLGSMGIDFYPSFRASNLANPFTLSKIILKDLGREWDLLAIDAYSSRRGDGGDGIISSAEHGLRDFLMATAELSVAHGGPALVVNAERGSYCDWPDAFDSRPVKSMAHDLVRSLIISRSTPCAYYSLHVPVNRWEAYRHRKNKTEKYKKGQDYGAIWRASFDENGQLALTPRPSGAAHAVAARELAFVSPGKEFRISDLYGYTFSRKDGGSLAALWSSGRELELALNLPEGCGLSDMMGNRRQLPAGRNVLKLGAPAIFISIPREVALADSIFEKAELVGQETVLVAGTRLSGNRIRLFAANCEAGSKKIQIRLENGAAAELQLDPMATAAVEAAVDRDYNGVLKGTVAANGKTYDFAVDASFVGLPELKSQPVFDGSGKWFRDLPLGRLKAPENVFPKAALMSEWGLFNGSDKDPNAEYSFAYDRNYFYLAVRMNNDSEHIQKGKISELWRGDSIQLAFSTREVPPAELRKKNETAVFGESEHNISLALGENGPVLYDYGARKRLDYPMNVTRKADSVLYEVAIPWSKLGIVPRSGDGLKFGFTIFDYRKDRNYELSFSRGISGTQDPALLKTIILK